MPHASPIGSTAPPVALAMLEPLQAVLAVRGGERILEVGAGSGFYTVEIAGSVRPGGSVDIVDSHPDLLAEAMQAAEARGLHNVTPTLGDARFLPYGDGAFDAAYLVAALGDMADRTAALRELRRVLRRGGRIAVGELNGDPHRVGPAPLEACAASAGLVVARHVDGLLGYIALLEPRA